MTSFPTMLLHSPNITDHCPGFVPNYGKADSRGKKILQESNHCAAGYLFMPSDDEGQYGSDGDSDADTEAPLLYDPENDYELKTHKAQDLHTILAVLLRSYRQLEDQGMIWDYKYRGKLYKNLELVFFVAFIKCDGDEADKLTGHYRSRGEKVKCLCRYCLCPTAEADDQQARYPLRVAETIRKMVKRDDERGLKRVSQQNINNALHELRFGLHNGMGVHGACPMELLHHILLGIFKYVRDQFFIQIGIKSEAAEEINALAKILGKFFARQSDRDLPKTNFAKGIFEGKIMGKEFSGVMLLIAAILQVTEGKATLQGKKRKKRFFKKQELIDNWALLVETMLEWEAYLKLDRMQKKHVERLRTKHRYIMYLIKRIIKRTKGVGMKFIKFHAILHLVMDIMNFGVPNNVDTGSNESHHKLTKLCAKLTQRDISEFEKQTSARLVEYLLLELAMAELGGRSIWEYFVLDQERGPVFGANEDVNDKNGEKDPDNDGDDTDEEYDVNANATTGGASLLVYWDPTDEDYSWQFNRNRSGNLPPWSAFMVRFLGKLQEQAQVAGLQGDLIIRSEHKRNGQIFRGHPNYRKKGQWNDWALFDWGRGHGHLPGEIWCFVDFTDAPAGFSLQIDGGKVQNGVYAVIESSLYEEQPRERLDRKSDLFTPLVKQYERMPGTNTNRPRYWLADVQSIVAPCCIIPDIGSQQKRRYFEVTPRAEWSNLFIQWLQAPHTEEKAEMESDEEE